MKPTLRLEMRPAETQELQLVCNCCGQPYHPDKACEDRLRAIVFGAEKYANCPSCTQEVPEQTLRDEGYRQRCRDTVTKWRKQFETESRVPAVLGRLASGNARPFRCSSISLRLRRLVTSLCAPRPSPPTLSMRQTNRESRGSVSLASLLTYRRQNRLFENQDAGTPVVKWAIQPPQKRPANSHAVKFIAIGALFSNI